MAFKACSDAIIPLMVEFHIALRSEKLFDDIEIEITPLSSVKSDSVLSPLAICFASECGKSRNREIVPSFFLRVGNFVRPH